MTNRKRKGISPIIATVLLIAITIAAGLAIYGWVSGLISAGTSSRIVGTTSLTLTLEEVNSADNSATILIRNEGSYNVILNSTNIELFASNGTVTTPVSTSLTTPHRTSWSHSYLKNQDKFSWHLYPRDHQCPRRPGRHGFGQLDHLQYTLIAVLLRYLQHESFLDFCSHLHEKGLGALIHRGFGAPYTPCRLWPVTSRLALKDAPASMGELSQFPTAILSECSRGKAWVLWSSAAPPLRPSASLECPGRSRAAPAGVRQPPKTLLTLDMA